MKKIFVCVLAVMMVLFNLSGVAFAQENVPVVSEPSLDVVERVCEEVLTGNITNHEDVIAVAVAQSIQKATAYSLASEITDEPLQITQVLDVQDNPDGTTEANMAVTALLVLDESGMPLSLKDEYYHMSTPGGLSGHQVYATHTMYTKGQADPDNVLNPQRKIQVVRMETTLNSGPFETVTKLIHRYGETLDIADYETHLEEETIHYPQAYNTYSYVPYGSSLLSVPYRLGSYVQTSVEIFVGANSFVIENTLPLDGSSLPGNLIYGW